MHGTRCARLIAKEEFSQAAVVSIHDVCQQHPSCVLEQGCTSMKAKQLLQRPSPYAWTGALVPGCEVEWCCSRKQCTCSWRAACHVLCGIGCLAVHPLKHSLCLSPSPVSLQRHLVVLNFIECAEIAHAGKSAVPSSLHQRPAGFASSSTRTLP